MNKKKVAALFLAGALTIGAGTYASYAWFTAQTTTSNFQVTMGNLAIAVENQSPLERLGSFNAPNMVSASGMTLANLKSQANTNFLKADGKTNLAPGDTVVKYFDIRNTGTIAQKVKFDPSVIGRSNTSGTPNYTTADELNPLLKLYVADPTTGVLTPVVTNTDGTLSMVGGSTLVLDASAVRTVVAEFTLPTAINNGNQESSFNFNIEVNATQVNSDSATWGEN